MLRRFRKYHHWFAIVWAFPLLLVVITGMLFPVAKALHQERLAEFLIHLHTLETFGLDTFFPLIMGLGLLGLLLTGISMTRLIRQRRSLA